MICGASRPPQLHLLRHFIISCIFFNGIPLLLMQYSEKPNSGTCCRTSSRLSLKYFGTLGILQDSPFKNFATDQVRVCSADLPGVEGGEPQQADDQLGRAHVNPHIVYIYY
jgi:hypothetical protein